MSDPAHVRWLLPLPALVAAPAYAATYLTVPEAQALLFPGQALAPLDAALTAEDAAAIERAAGTRARSQNPKVWRAADGGWFFLDQVIGKHELITYAVALDAAGAVLGVEILDYRETWGGEVRNPAWRAQFVGKRAGAPLRLDADIRNISGATLSCRHVTEGVRRLLATHALLAAKP